MSLFLQLVRFQRVMPPVPGEGYVSLSELASRGRTEDRFRWAIGEGLFTHH